MPDDALLTRFQRSFCGNLSFFTIHAPPFRKAEEKDKIMPSWLGFAKYGTKSFPNVPEGFAKDDFVPLTDDYYRKHLNGELGLAITPIFSTPEKKNVCYHAALDIDIDTNFTWFVSRMEHFGLKCIPTVSKSNGLHIYFIFSQPEPAAEVIKTLERIITIFGINRLFTNKKDKGKVEIFPKAATCVPGEQNANGLLLPFFDTAHKSKQGMLTAEGKIVGLVKAMPIIESRWTSVKELNAVLDELPYSDAPYCIQMILLTGALAENDGRNNFLFSAAIYLKKSLKENFEDILFEMNECLEAPLEDKDVKGVYTSVITKGYDNYSCKKSPCSDYCDKKLCSEREYGVGKVRNNRFTGADCWGELSKVMEEEPYYLWEVRINPDEDFKTVRVDSVDDLQNQSVMQKRCWRDLNWAPFRVKDNDWIATVNKAMEGIEERYIAIPEETDTTEVRRLRNLFMRYLTHKQVQNGQPYMVRLNLVYHVDGFYYFTTDGFKTFLTTERFSLRGYNLHDILTKQYGCTDGEVLYTTAKGEAQRISCWKKADDAELLEMDTFYADIYDGDADILQKNKLNKEEKEGSSDGVKF
jgi:hypothetical protein